MNETLKDQALLVIQDTAIRQKIANALNSLAYQAVSPPPSIDGIREQIKSIPYKVIVLEDGFQNMPLRENVIYRDIIQMPMPLRRNIFFILVGRKMENPEYMGAFSMSANLFLDSEKIKEMDLLPVLQQEVTGYTHFYQVYYRVKEQINQGK